MTPSSARAHILRGPPLTLQIVCLLIAGLIVAQAVTLFLTLLLPPAPALQYGLDDIAAVLGEREPSADAKRKLIRSVQSGRPDLSGSGWLMSDKSRHELAGLLKTDADDVLLSFYTPLPFAGTTMTPPHAANGVQDGNSWASPASAAPRFIPANYVVYAQAGPPPGGGFPGGGFPGGGFPGGGFPGGGFPGGGFPGGPGGMPPRGGSSPDGAGSLPRQPREPTPQERRTTEQAPAPQGQPDNGGQPIGGQQRAPAPPPDLGGAAAQPVIVPQPLPVPLPDIRVAEPAPPRKPAQAADRPITEQPRTETAAPAQAAPAIPPGTGGSFDEEASAQTEQRLPAASDTASDTVPLPQPARGLFGLAPAPFVEGDFIAAWRMPNGQWAVVHPAPEAFPNSWQRRVLLWFAIALAIVVPLGWLFARRIVKPLGGFASAAEQLGRDPAAPILPLYGPAEVGRAANAFNLMQSRLRTFVDDRTAMIGAISHDLRTPLTRLRFRIEDVDDQRLRDGMIEEVADMETMITSVLEYLRDVSAPGVRERVDLGAIVDDAVGDAKMVGRRVEIESLENATVEIDVLSIRRVIDNLLENAVKYGEAARVSLSVQDDNAVAEIVDCGPGLPESELECVFTPFYRSADARASVKPGSGLGLAVCRSIARAHGGDVYLSNVDDGLKAQVVIPLAFDQKQLMTA